MLMVRDLGSLNGTFVGEMRIAEQAMPVKPGDLITVGPVTFRAVYRDERQRAKPGSWDADGPTVDAPPPSRLDSARRYDDPPAAQTRPTATAPASRAVERCLARDRDF